MGKIGYESHFKSKRTDGRHISSLAAFTDMLRSTDPKLSLPEELDRESFLFWQSRVKEKFRELLRMPEIKLQEPPKKLYSEKREGYTAEKWELYPNEYEAVPFLVLIPEGASAKNQTPGVICLPGSIHSKEFIADEPLLEPYNCRFEKVPERNKMALYLVKNGMTAFVFDNLAIAELGLPTSSPDVDVWNCHSRVEMVFGYLQAGVCYPGIATYHLLSFLQYISCFDFVDKDRLGVCAHSLGTEAAMSLALLSEDIKAIVFNDFLCNGRRRYSSITEVSEGNMELNIGIWHVIPGMWEYFDFPDLCAAIAPKYITFNEGGADECFEVVKRAYRVSGAMENLSVSHYPKYAKEEDRKHHGKVPRYGLTSEEFYEISYCDAPDHSFREEPSVRMLKKAFGM